MRVREHLLEQFPVLHGIIRAFRSPVLRLLVKMSVTQCPGLKYSRKVKQGKCITRLVVLLSPLSERGIRNIGERGVRERERITVNHLFMMRAGPISAH